MGKNLLAAGVKDTYNFGPVLIKDGEAHFHGLKQKILSTYSGRNGKPNDYVLLVTDTGSYNVLITGIWWIFSNPTAVLMLTTWMEAVLQPCTLMEK